jgi:hypothetical protein
MEQAMNSLIHVVEIYRYGFLIFSFVAIVVLLYEVNRNRKQRGYAYFALIYFVFVFVYYLLRFFNIPSDPIVANLLSNFIRTLGSIFIFFVAYSLLKD